MSDAPARVLLVRGDTLGDWILTEPLIRALRSRFPSAEVGLLLREPVAEIAGLLAPGAEVFVARFNPHAGVLDPDAPELQALAAALRAWSPEVILAPAFNATWLERWTAGTQSSARAFGLGGAPADALSRAEELRRQLPVGAVECAARVPEELAEPDKLRAFAQGLGLELPGAPKLHLADSPEPAAKAYAVCAPGGLAHVPIKAWPAAHFAEVIAWLQATHALPTVLCVHADERALGEAVQAAARRLGAEPELQIGAPGAFAEVAATLAQARLYFGNDTGVMHAAAALGRPTLGIFGGGTWPRFLPWGSAATAAAVQPLACFGCGWRCRFHDAPCLRELPVPTVQTALNWLLQAGSGEHRTFEVPEHEGLGAEVRAFIARTESARRSAPAGEVERLAERLQASEEDRAARLQVIERQGAELARLQREVDGTVRELFQRLEASETDRAERLRVIERQGQDLGDLRSRLNQVQSLHDQLKHRFTSSEQDRAERLQVIEQQGIEAGRLRASVQNLQQALELAQSQLARSEADRAARLKVIEEQGVELGQVRKDLSDRAVETLHLRQQLRVSEDDRAARLKVIEEQGVVVDQLRRHLTQRTGELTELQGHFAAAEADRAARLKVIEELGPALDQVRRDLVARQAEVAALQGSLSELREQLERAEADRTARTKVIEERGAALAKARHEVGELQQRLAESESTAGALRVELEALRGRVAQLENSSLARTARKVGLWPK